MYSVNTHRNLLLSTQLELHEHIKYPTHPLYVSMKRKGSKEIEVVVKSSRENTRSRGQIGLLNCL